MLWNRQGNKKILVYTFIWWKTKWLCFIHRVGDWETLFRLPWNNQPILFYFISEQLTFISSKELALFSSTSLLALEYSATRFSRFLQFSKSCWMRFSFERISSSFFLASSLNVSAWFWSFCFQSLTSLDLELKEIFKKELVLWRLKMQLWPG